MVCSCAGDSFALDLCTCFSEDEVTDTSESISITRVMQMAGCSEPTVLRAIRLGQIDQRTGLPRGVLSLGRASAEQWADRWRARPERTPQRNRRRRTAPPDDQHQWISTKEASLFVGRSPAWLFDRAGRGLAPHVRASNRLWCRRDQVQAMGAVREPR